MAFPRTPGGLFPLTTAPTGRNAGGQYPLPAVLSDAIRSFAPTAYWKLDEASGNLADTMSGGHTATVTGSPTYGVAAPSPIGRGVTWSGSGQYATTSTSFPTPAAAISAVAIFATTNASAGNRCFVGRGDTGQFSWFLRLSSAHLIQFTLAQSSGTNHAQATTATAANDGGLHLAAGTFDGTTVNAYRLSASGSSSVGTSTSLTGSWHTASTAPVGIAHGGYAAQSFPGTLYGVVAVWDDIALSAAALRYLASVAFGG